MKEIIEKFKKYLQVNNLSYSTVNSYIYHLTFLLKQIKIDDITTESITDYYLSLKDKYSPSTIAISKIALSNFLEFLNISGVKIPKNGKKRKSIPEFITLKFLENNILPMVEVLFDRPLKTKTVLYFMFYSGLRISEVASLKRSDFDLENKTVKIYSKKNKTERIIPYPKKIKDILEIYFDIEAEEKGAFNIRIGGINTIFQKLKPYFKDINLHPHLFRHAAATNWRINKISIEDIQYYLGHSDIHSTMIYAHADTKSMFTDFWKKIK